MSNFKDQMNEAAKKRREARIKSEKDQRYSAIQGLEDAEKFEREKVAKGTKIDPKKRTFSL